MLICPMHRRVCCVQATALGQRLTEELALVRDQHEGHLAEVSDGRGGVALMSFHAQLWVGTFQVPGTPPLLDWLRGQLKEAAPLGFGSH
jgi:hypothetical protein